MSVLWFWKKWYCTHTHTHKKNRQNLCIINWDIKMMWQIYHCEKYQIRISCLLSEMSNLTQVLMVRSLISFNVQQAVASPEATCAVRALWFRLGLTVAHDQETWGWGPAWGPGESWVSSSSLGTWKISPLFKTGYRCLTVV